MKKFSSRFSMATHILAMIAHFQSVTSEQMAVSVGTNPVVIRRIIGQLKKAKLVNVKAGVGGATLAKNSDDITILDIYRAVEVVEENELFNIHDDMDPECPIGAYIEISLRKMMLEAQAAMEGKLASVTLTELTNELIAIKGDC